MKKINDNEKNIESFFKLSRPNDELYKTYSKKKVFSEEYSLKVPNYILLKSGSSIVEVAFNYLARFMIARIINKNKINFISNLNAEDGIDYFKEEDQKLIFEQYDIYLEEVEHYINGSDEISLKELTKVACFLSRLEHAKRKNWIPIEQTLKFIKKEDKEILNEVNHLGIVFYDDFIFKNMVKENSVVVFNPYFGRYCKNLKPFISLVYIDGVLWNLKTTKINVKNSEDLTKMWQYLVFHSVCKITGEQNYSLRNLEIKALAFFKARFGEIEFLKTKDIDKNELTKACETTLKLIGEINLNQNQRDIENNLTI